MLACLQAEIHELLLQFAEAGATVVRLKGGDPYVFGRYVLMLYLHPGCSTCSRGFELAYNSVCQRQHRSDNSGYGPSALACSSAANVFSHRVDTILTAKTTCRPVLTHSATATAPAAAAHVVGNRGGEEVQYLQQQGITVQCVPGITAAAGICAELGIPMTHRGVATSVRFLTGHAREGGQAMLDDTIIAAADPNTTLVVYMGLSTLPQLVQQLQQHGLPADVPAVAVERGTTAEQRVVFGTLADLQEGIKAVQLKSPTLLIIGQVVALSPGWQEWRETGAVSGAAAAQADRVHDCARLQLPDAVAAVLQLQQQQQQQPHDLQELSRR